MAKKIHVRPGKGSSKAGFAMGIIFCLIGVCIAIPTFGLFGVLWTAMAGCITFINFRNGFTDKQIDSHVIEIDENGENTESAESVEERLKTLTELYMQSLITGEEYEQKKKEILDEL